MEWKLADAKNKLSEVVNRAIEEGPQIITRRKDVVVLVSQKEYQELKGEKRSFTDFLLNGPGLDEVNLNRTKDPMRSVDL